MPISERVQAAVDTWPRWQLALERPPQIIKPLTGGLTNQCYLLKADGHRLVLRVNAINSLRLGIDRSREREILAALAGRDFAPQVYYCEPDEQVLVTEYVEGRHWLPGDVAQRPDKQSELLSLIEKIHGCDIPTAVFDYASHVRQYWQQLCAGQAPVPLATYHLYRTIEPLLDEFQRGIEKAVLCHHDFSPTNIIEDDSGRLVVLDWEFAGRGEQLMDFAALGQAWNLTDALPRPLCAQRRQLAEQITRFLNQIWPLLVNAHH